MKYCIDCGKNNGYKKVTFVGAQCADCYRLNPIVLIIPPEHEKKMIGDSVGTFDTIRFFGKDKLYKRPVKEVKPVKYCGCGVVIWRSKEKCFKCKKVDRKAEKVVLCKICGQVESEDNKMRRFVRKSGVECVYPQHIGCSAVADRITVIRGAKVKVEYIKKQRGRKLGSGVSLAQRIFNLPESKECTCCKEDKLITEFYTNKGIPYHRCKKCHKKDCNIWRKKNIESVKEYHKEYNKTYVRKSKRELKMNLPPNGI